ncbi:FimV/HubP family polar landmark protein [Psychromonas sp. KJ10-2]|uniref:FimV/HubP family polar landmark protein n=1 Tax=Psychromonas sp. KJ10-2 TaxID=3391822 RepID=UPI0039B3AE27
MNRMLLAVVSCLPLLFSAHSAQSVELVGPNDEPQVTPSSVSVTAPNNTTPVRYGPVTANETLWSISNKLRPNNNVSVYQTLVAIYKTNPTAFRNGDINKIIATSVIDVPSLAVISQQTNAEAFRLLRITNTPAAPAVKPAATVVPEKVESTVEEPAQAEAGAEEIETVAEEGQKTAPETTNATNEQLLKLEQEYAALNEQLIQATESNQRLKLKLQPLSDQIHTLSEQVEEDINVQIELQALIDQYKAEIEAFEAPPFSGPGLLNQILSSITGSASTLLLTILSPLLLLTALFLLILRIKSKRELALKEQELAESTALLEEEDNEFDSLFATDVSEEEPESKEDDADLTIIEEQVSEEDELITSTDTELIEDEQASTIEDELDIDIDAVINGDDEVIELSESDLELDEETSQSDLDLAAQWESELAELETNDEEQVDLDEFDFDSVDQTPLEPIKLDEVEAELEASTDDLTIEEESQPEAIPEVEELLTETKPEPSAEVEPAIDTSLDVEEESQPEAIPEVEELLTETKPEPSAEVESAIDNSLDIEEESQPEAIPEVEELLTETKPEPSAEVESAIDSSLDVEEESQPEAIPEVEALLDETTAANELLAEAEPERPTDTSGLAESDEVETPLDSDALLTESDAEDETAAETMSDIDKLLSEYPEDLELSDDKQPLDLEQLLAESSSELDEEFETETENDDQPEAELDTEDTLDLEELLAETSSEVEEELESDIDQAAEEQVEQAKQVEDESDELDFTDPDTLAKQLSSNAFNEEAELPKFDKSDDKGFIDIDTLLTNDDGQDLTEEEFDLDFGLDEFPDVVESFAEFDTDADGVAAQLDLARAYLEIDEKESAKTILTELLENAPEDKLKEVKKLFDKIS